MKTIVYSRKNSVCDEEITETLLPGYEDDNYIYNFGYRYDTDNVEILGIPDSMYDQVKNDVKTICKSYNVEWKESTI
jgi:hypothetical protein